MLHFVFGNSKVQKNAHVVYFDFFLLQVRWLKIGRVAVLKSAGQNSSSGIFH
jgi:hypothetical protein